MYDQFKIKAESVSAEVHRFSTQATALEFIRNLLGKEGIGDTPQQYAVWAGCPFLDHATRQQLSGISGLHFKVTRELAAESRIGISQMDWALADTGTLVQDATAIDKRLVSTLPTIHVALISSASLLPDMATWLTEVDPKDTGYIAMITGPSRTADIERVLTIGVHGPERLIIIVIDEAGEEH